jgi:hypothetical protein
MHTPGGLAALIGQFASGRLVVAANVTRLASVKMHTKRNKLGSGRRVWFGMGNLDETDWTAASLSSTLYLLIVLIES